MPVTMKKRFSARGPSGPRSDDHAKPQPTDEKREREEVDPADNVFGPRRPGCSVGVGRRRRLDAHAEREHARDNVPVVGDGVPANRVRACRQARKRRPQVAPVGPHAHDSHAAPLRVDLDRAGHGRHKLVEPEGDRARCPLDPLTEPGLRLLERRVRERLRRKREREQGGDEQQASHRCGVPACGARCPKTGAMSRSQ